ncbi:MAG: tail fiber protein [Rhizobiales bacterium]|nr:tail fiber protein [Hyphomicrobiales bacterium]
MEAFIGEVRAFPYRFNPVDETRWLLCDGTLYPTRNFQALFSVIGNIYGGDARTTFGVPDLRTRVPVGTGQGAGLNTVAYGAVWGTNDVTLAPSELPIHKHALKGAFTGAATDLSDAPGPTFSISRTFNQFDYSNEVLANPAFLDPRTIEVVGGAQPHENRQPVVAITYFICCEGEYPTRP